jgi:hypothetical protein
MFLLKEMTKSQQTSLLHKRNELGMSELNQMLFAADELRLNVTDITNK